MDMYHLYMDDSGTRHPDRKQGRKPKHGGDYFSLGGILVARQDEDVARKMHADFCERWNITAPLHSSEIRARSKNFAFIGTLNDSEQDRFREELYCFMRECPVIGIACVIDRPGYNERYTKLYGKDRWSLCKTAFCVCVERAAKYAAGNNAKLKVFPEQSDKNSDRMLRSYYDGLRQLGMPFDAQNSAPYAPMEQTNLNSILSDFKLKQKSSPMAQLADLYLWPMCMGGYDRMNRPYKRLVDDKKLIDCLLTEEQKPMLGIKYSCWDLVEKTKARKCGL